MCSAERGTRQGEVNQVVGFSHLGNFCLHSNNKEPSSYQSRAVPGTYFQESSTKQWRNVNCNIMLYKVCVILPYPRRLGGRKKHRTS